jgi:hypothetical protein
MHVCTFPKIFQRCGSRALFIPSAIRDIIDCSFPVRVRRVGVDDHGVFWLQVFFFRPNMSLLRCLQFSQYNKERHQSKGIRGAFRRVRGEGKEGVHSEKSSKTIYAPVWLGWDSLV